MSFPIVGSCPACGAPIYNKPVVLADSKDMTKEPVMTEVRDDNGLPKNFFTCNCRLPKFQIADGTSGKLPVVDMDKVHEEEPVRKYTLSSNFKLTSELIEGLSKDSPSKNFLREYRKKCVEQHVFNEEQLLVDRLNAMERLQELTKLGYGVRIREKKEGEKRVVEYAKWSYEFGLYEQRKLQYGDNISEAILNIKIEEGESNG